MDISFCLNLTRLSFYLHRLVNAISLGPYCDTLLSRDWTPLYCVSNENIFIKISLWNVTWALLNFHISYLLARGQTHRELKELWGAFIISRASASKRTWNNKRKISRGPLPNCCCLKSIHFTPKLEHMRWKRVPGQQTGYYTAHRAQ